MRDFLSRYSLKYPTTIVYMLQSSEYKVPEYLKWLGRTSNFSKVAKRRQLDYTSKAKLLLTASWLVILLFILIGVLAALRITGDIILGIGGLLLIILIPWILSYVIVLPLWVGRILIQAPEEKKMIAAAREKIAKHKGYKIAIAGSYGKTTAKEVLGSVIGQSRKIAVTPGNMNTAIGISRFINKLDGDEDVLVFELGEEKVGDVAMLCELAQPDAGFITGISPAHLSSFGTMDNIVSTIFELKDYLGDKLLYLNGESSYVADKAGNDAKLYDRNGVDDWTVSDVRVSVTGTKFSIQKGSKIIWAESGLLGAHNVGILTAAIALADRLKLTIPQIVDGLDETVPFEHRMQPRRVSGAWIIDDTYNGNLAGIRVGLELLDTLKAERRIYVTPGLVEQGDKTEEIHLQIGKYIAASKADEVVLMQNSVVDYISEGLHDGKFKGKLIVVDDPLNFYTNIDQFVAHGDVVLMQNDWTDNYN